MRLGSGVAEVGCGWMLNGLLRSVSFRIRKSVRLGKPHFNFAKSGLSSLSMGRRGSSANIPVARAGRSRNTIGLPGTEPSWRVEALA